MQVKSSSFLWGKVVNICDGQVSYIFCVFENILNEISLVCEIYVWRFIEAFVLTLEICLFNRNFEMWQKKNLFNFLWLIIWYDMFGVKFFQCALFLSNRFWPICHAFYLAFMISVFIFTMAIRVVEFSSG